MSEPINLSVLPEGAYNLSVPVINQIIEAISPTATVEKTGDTTTITITDKNGTTSAEITDGTGGNATYVTPEDYGAKGDGTTDDTTALQNCIDYARTNYKSVKGFNRYKTSTALSISGDYQDIEINRISYSGNDCGVRLTGTHNNIKINYLYCSNGKGLILKRTSSTSCQQNTIKIMRLFAKNHAVDFEAENYIIYNTFDIRDIKSDTGNCFNGNRYAGENVYLNSSCACSNGWAIYKANGRYYNFTLESNVKNGIYLDEGYSYFAGFRVRELVDKLVSRINGDNPEAVGGTLIKYAGNYLASKFVCDDTIPYEAIDASDMDTPESLLEETPVDWDALARLAFFQTIDAPIRYGNWDTNNGYIVPGKQMIVVGGRKICIPAYETVYTVTDADYDMRDAEVALNDAKIYPTKMIIGVDDCVIHLPASYCAYGYSEFIVDQNQGHLCTIYDSNSTTTPIFNGDTLGSGVYKLKAYCDVTRNAISDNRSGSTMCYNDSSNHVWEIIKLGESSGGASLNYVTPEQFGAVGDGETDDSQAVQDAVDAGYAVYFASNKTYYLASAVTIDHDCHLFGGENAVIKLKKPVSSEINNAFVIAGDLKKTTTLTTDYEETGTAANSANQFTLSDMTDINIGDIMVIQATDQYYSYSRQYYYLGATLQISDINDGHLFTTESLPFDIENTENVTVRIYDAPCAVIENLHFISDNSNRERWYYKYCIRMDCCKNSTIRNCIMEQFDSGIGLFNCVNTLVENVMMSKAPIGDEMMGDAYGIEVLSSTNTIIKRINSLCAQGCVNLSGELPNINTYIYDCNLSSETRSVGFDMHENSYNLVMEDCVLGGAAIYGTAYINRCRIIRNKRNSESTGISFTGSHNERYARFTITNCVFENDKIYVSIRTPQPQTPIQSFDAVIGELMISNCIGGYIMHNPRITEDVTSLTVKSLIIRDWEKCYEIYHTNGNVIEYLEITNSSFTKNYWINAHTDAINMDSIRYLHIKSDNPQMDRLFVNALKHGDRYVLPEGTGITLSASNAAHYTSCGKNVMSNDPDDISIGGISGSAGDVITRTVNSDFNNALSVDNDGNLVFTQPNSTSTSNIYLKCFAYVNEDSFARISCKLKNTGVTSGSAFYAYIVILDGETGKIIRSTQNSSSVTATSEGAIVSHNWEVVPGNIVLFYLRCSSPVANSVTTFEEYVAELVPITFDNGSVEYKPYVGTSRDGNGSLESIAGINNVMSSAFTFATTIKADMNEQPVLLNASGVNF